MAAEVGTPESIRRQYAAPPHETPEERRRRLANKRAAKYRALRNLVPERVVDQREKSSVRQRNRRQRLDEATRARIREQNRQRQQLRRQRLKEDERESIREAQRQRAQKKRSQLDEKTRNELRIRERERQRVQRRLQREAEAAHLLKLQREEATSRRSEEAQQQQQQKQQEEEDHQQQQQQEHQQQQQQPRLPQLRVTTNVPVHRSIPSLSEHTNVQLPSVSEARGATSSTRRDKELPSLHPPPRHAHHHHHPRPSHAPFNGIQFSLPPPPPPTSTSASSGLHKQPTLATATRPFPDRVRPLPHLQVALPQASSLLHPPPPPVLLIPAPPSAASLTAPVSTSSLAGSVSAPSPVTSNALGTSSLSLPMSQPPLAPIVLPPAHRSLPPLPDFLNSREVFDPTSAATSSFFQSRNDQASEYHSV